MNEATIRNMTPQELARALEDCPLPHGLNYAAADQLYQLDDELQRLENVGDVEGLELDLESAKDENNELRAEITDLRAATIRLKRVLADLEGSEYVS